MKRRHSASTGRASLHRVGVTVGLWLILELVSGCATYSEKLADVRLMVDRGAYPAALDELNGILGVDAVDELPDSWKGDRVLAVLERAVLLQTESEFELSARDLGNAETELELLDLQTDVVGKIGSYVYSDSAEDYRASPTEQLALNGLNMMNYLATGDLSGAAVEARRFTDMREYLDSIQLERSGTFGAYLAGFVFERLGQGDRALRYYEEALESGPLDSLTAPIRRLARIHPYRGPRIEALLSQEGVETGAEWDRPSEILVVLALGRVPYKVPERIPIGAAVGLAGTWITGNAEILERSLFKVVIYPELVNSGTRARQASVAIDQRSADVDQVTNLGADIAREYELIKPRIIGAAVTRLITRAAVAEGARVAGRQAGDGGDLIGLLAALLAEGTMVALDKPDTRSWTLLPERVAIARVAVQPGAHEVTVRIPDVGESRSIAVEVPRQGFGVVVVTVPR